MKLDKCQWVVCQLWPHHDPRFSDRQYAAWYGRCSKCSSKVVVTNRTHRLMQTTNVSLICEQCAELQRVQGESSNPKSK